MSQRPDTPDQVDVIRAWIDQHVSEIHTGFPGRVESYDATKQTANVRPMIKQPFPQPDGSIEYEDLPIVTSVPILFPRVRGWFVAFGVDEGDTVAVVTTELSFAHWRETAGDEVAYPGDQRRHHLANAFAIPGLYVTQDALTHAPTTGMVIGSDDDAGTRIALNTDGSLVITRGSTVVLQIDADGTNHLGGALADQFVALSNLVDANFSTLQAYLTALVLPVSGATAGPPAVPCPPFPSTAATKARAT